jgi:hypothetical protein
MRNEDDFSRPIRFPTDDPAEQAEIRRRVKAGDLALFVRVILTLCSIEQRAELKQRLLQRDCEGLMSVARAIVAKECRPEAGWAFDSGAAPFRRPKSRSGRLCH